MKGLEIKNTKNILAINGSAGLNSSNASLINCFAKLTEKFFTLTAFDLKSLPHFDTDLSVENVPDAVSEFRNLIQNADGILICTPEYVFSIPSSLKNAIEWCVSTDVFSEKPTGLITASADGRKAHQELQLILKTVMAKFSSETALLIQGVKGKINERDEIIDSKTLSDVLNFIEAYQLLVDVDDN